MKIHMYLLCVLLLVGCPGPGNQIDEAIKKIEVPPDEEEKPAGEVGIPVKKEAEKKQLATEQLFTAIIDLLTPVDSKGPGGGTALMWKSGLGEIDAIAHLLEMGADVNAQDDNGQTALMGAAYYGRSVAVKMLIEKGRADVNLKDNNGRTALSIAVQREHRVIVVLLKAAGATE